jgi:DNA helicase-2/ATP-dependent DNA helicase PcrA
LLKRLNKEQAETVTQQWGPSLVIAGAGSGKTTVLTRRIAYLITRLNQEPESILSVTFTNKAAAEMRHRIEQIVGTKEARRISIGTFHSVCAKLLRQEIEHYQTEDGLKWDKNFVIYDETDTVNLIKAQIKKMNLDEKVFVPKETRHTISALKNDGYTHLTYSREAKNYRETRISEIFCAYQQELARNNALDFDDLILMFTDLIQQNANVRERMQRRYRHVLVDEFQDTNKSQYDLISIITKVDTQEHFLGREALEGGWIENLDRLWHHRSLMVVGDVDQSIYSWRKADFRIILGFQKDYIGCKLIKLEENYRSTATILEVANSIIANNSERIDKTLRCNKGQGGKVNCYEAQDEIDEGYYIAKELKNHRSRGRNLADCCILYRTNSQSRAIEEVLVRSHIPYVMVGGTRFYDRQEIKDMLAYLKLVYNPKDGQAFNRVINVPKRGLGKTTLEKISSFAEMKNMSPLEACFEVEQIDELTPKAKSSLYEFGSLIAGWNEESQRLPVSDLLEQIVKGSLYIAKLEEEAETTKDEATLGRIDNIRELIAVAKEFESSADEPNLEAFLTRISLVSDLDNAQLGEDAVKLMTIHSSKGLEFPVAFIMGLEEGLFPHMRSLDSEAQIEEERRLMYVAVTRAGDALHMTLARKRTSRGFNSGGGFSSSYTIPSRFLREIAPHLITGYYPSGEEQFRTAGGGQSGGQNSGSFGGRRSGGYQDDSFSQNGYEDNNLDRFGRKREYDGGGSKYGSDYGSGSGSSSGYGGGNRSGSGAGSGWSGSNRSGSGSGSNYGSGNGSGSGSNSGYGGGSRSGSGAGSGYGGGSRPGAGSGSGYGSGSRPGSGSGAGYGGSGRAAAGSSAGSGSRPSSSGSSGSSGQVKPRAMRLPPQEAKSEAPTYEKLALNDKVQHVKFGMGQIVEIIGDGDKELYNVNFEGHGKRLLDPKFAKLIKLS